MLSEGFTTSARAFGAVAVLAGKLLDLVGVALVLLEADQPEDDRA
jgi:hypothetical protein